MINTCWFVGGAYVIMPQTITLQQISSHIQSQKPIENLYKLNEWKGNSKDNFLSESIAFFKRYGWSDFFLSLKNIQTVLLIMRKIGNKKSNVKSKLNRATS